MADKNIVNVWDDINDNIEPQENLDLDNSDKNEELDKDSKAIKNIIEKYKTPEELAKAKRETDKMMSQVISEKRALEKLLKDEKEKKLKQLWDKNAILEAYWEDPEVADKVAQELFWKNAVDLDEDYGDYKIIEDDSWNQFIDMKDVEKLIDLKMKKMSASTKKEQIEIEKTKTKEEKINSFIEEKWIDFEEFSSYIEEFLELWDIDKVLKAAYGAYFNDIYEDNDKISKMKEKAATKMVWQSKKSNWDNLSYTEDDIKAAKYANMSIENYVKFKNEQIKKWNLLYTL